MDTEKVTIELPKPVMDFIRALSAFDREAVDHFLQRELLCSVESAVQELDGPWVDKLASKYGLTEILEDLKAGWRDAKQ